MEEKLDTFPRLMLHHASVRPTHPATREKVVGHLADLDVGAGRSRRARAGLRAGRAGLPARHAPRDHRRQPAAAVLVHVRRRRRWAAFRCRCTRTRRPPNSSTCSTMPRSRTRWSRTRSRSTRCSRRRRRCRTLAAHLFRRSARPAQLRERARASTALLEIGREFDRAHPGFFDGEVAKGTSPTTSRSCCTRRARPASRRACARRTRVHRRRARAARVRQARPRTTAILSYLPMAWVGDHLFSYAQWLVAGFTINCPESGDTVMTDLREIGPTLLFRAAARSSRTLLTQVMIRMEDASAVKRWLFRYFTAVARRCGAEILDGKPVCDRATALLYGSATSSSTDRCATCSG